MSTALAIAAVTAHLKDLLNNGLTDNVVTEATETPVIVMALAPDKAEEHQSDTSRLNLFLYQVSYNTAWRNMGMPIRNSDGNRVGQSPLALDLHYLLTAYDGGNEYGSEILLGYAMQLMHETPVLTRSQIRDSAASRVANDALPSRWQTVIIESGLAEQIEQIKITPQTLSTEEISRLWAAFGTKYRPTVSYQVSVVLIESQIPAKAAPPVKEPKVYINTLRQPTIEKIQHFANFDNLSLPEQPIVFGSKVVITGHRLRGESTVVRINDVEFLAPVPDLPEPTFTDNKIEITLSDENLKAGVQGVQVIHRIPKAGSEDFLIVAESNVAAFILRPSIEGIPVHRPREVRTRTLTLPERIMIAFSPLVGERQKVVLLLSDVTAKPSGAFSMGSTYRFEASELINDEREPNRQGVPVRNLPNGQYLVRAQVDGAESLLETHASGTGFVGPMMTIS